MKEEKETGCHILKNREKRLLPLRKIICVRGKKNKRDFFSRETYTRIIVIDLIIVKLFGVCPVIFPFKRKGFPRKYLCFVCDCYFRLLIF